MLKDFLSKAQALFAFPQLPSLSRELEAMSSVVFSEDSVMNYMKAATRHEKVS